MRGSEQEGVFPNVLGSRASHEASFQRRFRYKGLFDYAPWISMGDALDFRAACGGDEKIEEYLHTLSVGGSSLLAERWKTEKLVGDEQTGAIANVRLPIEGGAAALERLRAQIPRVLLFRFNMFAPVFAWDGALYARVSAAIYNELSDYAALADAVEQIVAEVADGGLEEVEDDGGGSIHF